ncbi:uncharacterized protein DFL_003149 [Arthrobotrys flagrans]|uniref:Uncharacterized protein n=1 Tax=Arthrobotrys flagrans TaxID=97331 RepID=A0A437A0L5_ARTFL|nr:hypothetical protein DFL_003149 [Arthrobotrys flagrans]
MKYAISLISLLAAAGAQADDSVIAGAFPNRPTASDCSSFLSATVTPVVSQTSWIKTTSTTTLAAPEIRTTTLSLGAPISGLPTETSSISYPYGDSPPPPGGRRRRAFGKVKRDDPSPPNPIPDGWYPEEPTLAAEIIQTATDLPTYAVTACPQFTSKGIVRAPTSRFSHACSCRGFMIATTRVTTSTHKTSYTVTTAITTYTPISWVIANAFKLQFTGASYDSSFVGTSTSSGATTFVKPTDAAKAAVFVIHPDRKPNFATPPDALVGTTSQPNDQDLRRITCNNLLLAVKKSTLSDNQRFLRVLSDPNPVSLPDEHFPLLCKIDGDSIFTCQGEGITTPVVDLGLVSTDPLLRIYGSNFPYSSGHVTKDSFQLKAIPAPPPT